MPPFVGPIVQHVLDPITEDGLDIFGCARAGRKANHLGPLRKQEALPEVVVEPHDLRGLEKLLLSQAEHRRVPLAGARAAALHDVADRAQR